MVKAGWIILLFIGCLLISQVTHEITHYEIYRLGCEEYYTVKLSLWNTSAPPMHCAAWVGEAQAINEIVGYNIQPLLYMILALIVYRIAEKV